MPVPLPLVPLLVLGAAPAVADGTAEPATSVLVELPADTADADVAGAAEEEANEATEVAKLARVSEDARVADPVATGAAEAAAEDPPDEPAESAAWQVPVYPTAPEDVRPV